MKIAILGAGFSGLYAAYLLEKKGHNVVIYEKEEIIGGHCRTLVGKDTTTELATTVFFSNAIKELLLELQLDYTNRLIYRNFLDENFQSMEQISKDQVNLLVDEFDRLKELLEKYNCLTSSKNYGYIHPDLLVSTDEFLAKNNLPVIKQVIAPPLSSFGFGDLKHVQAYYALHTFDLEIIRILIEGDKFLFIQDGTSALIQALCRKISCIRLSQEVINIDPKENHVLVETIYGTDTYDKVLVTAKLPEQIIKEPTLNAFMKKIVTNPFISCIYSVTNKRLAATYFKNNLGKSGKIQFFHTRRQNHKTTLVSYTYGLLSKNIVDNVTSDLKSSGVLVNHLITTKQWYIFPHIASPNLTPTFYEELLQAEEQSNIFFAGSLVSKPELGNLYHAVQESIDSLLNEKDR